jgi:Na+-driven multidrug efflux pump
MRPDLRIVGSIASLGVSPFIMQSTESLIAIVFTNALQRWGGADGDLYIGSYTVLQSVMQMMFIPAHGFAYGTQPIISYNYGAGNYRRVRKNFWIVSGICLAYTACFYLLTLLAPDVLAGMFTNNAALRALSARKLPIFLAGMVLFAFQLSAQTTLLGIGKAKASLFIACLRKIILLTPLALILPHFLGVDGIYIAEPVSDTISALTALCIVVCVMAKSLKGGDGLSSKDC